MWVWLVKFCIRIIELSDNWGSDNWGCTVYMYITSFSLSPLDCTIYDSSTVFQPEWIVEWWCQRQTACRSVQQWTEILAVRVSWQPAENVGGSWSAAFSHAPNTLGDEMKGGCKSYPFILYALLVEFHFITVTHWRTFGSSLWSAHSCVWHCSQPHSNRSCSSAQSGEV